MTEFIKKHKIIILIIITIIIVAIISVVFKNAFASIIGVGAGLIAVITGKKGSKIEELDKQTEEINAKIAESIKNQEILKKKIIDKEVDIATGEKKVEEIHKKIEGMNKDEFTEYLKKNG